MIKISDFCCACHQSLSPTPHSDGRQLPMCSPIRGLHGRKLASLPEPCQWPCEWAWRRLLLGSTLGVTAASVNTLIPTSQQPWARDPPERSQTPGPQTQWDTGCWWCFCTTVLSKKFLKRLMEEGLWEWGGWESPLKTLRLRWRLKDTQGQMYRAPKSSTADQGSSTCKGSSAGKGLDYFELWLKACPFMSPVCISQLSLEKWALLSHCWGKLRLRAICHQVKVT